MHFTRTLTILDVEGRIQCIRNENISSGFSLTTSAIIALRRLMTESYMLLTNEADNDSFDVFEAFLAIRIIK